MPSETTVENEEKSLERQLAGIRGWLKWLTAAVFIVALALLFFVTAVYGQLVNYFSGEAKLVASASVGGTIMGFLFGWLARSAARG